MFHVKATVDGLTDPLDFTVTSRDIAKWEMGGKGRSVSGLESNARMLDMYDISFLAADRLGLFDGDIRAWRETVDLDVQPVGEATDPTQPAP